MHVYIIFLISIITISKILDYYSNNIVIKLGTYNVDFFNKGKFAFCVVYGLLAFFSAIRDGIGIDYNSYLWHIINIRSGNNTYMEIGFRKICILLSYIDSNPRLVLIVMSILTCYFYLKAIWEQSEDHTISIFMFLSWGYYFLTFTTVRNYLALSIELYAIKFLHKGDKRYYFVFALLTILAATIHKSALICLPVYFLAKLKLKQQHFLYLLGLLLIVLSLKNYIRKLVFIFYPGYENSVYDTGRISWLNVLKALAVVVLCLMYYPKIKYDNINRFYFNLNVFALLYYAGLYWMPEVSRIGFYMNTTSIFLIPNLLKKIKGGDAIFIKIIFYILSMLLFIMLMQQFKSPNTLLLPYKTWLFDSGY